MITLKVRIGCESERPNSMLLFNQKRVKNEVLSMANDNKPDTPIPSATPAPKTSERENFNDAPDNPFDRFKFDTGDREDRQEKQDGMQELMEILKDIATDFNNAAMTLGSKIYSHFNSQENDAKQDATQQESPIPLQMAADTQDTKSVTPLGNITPTPEPSKTSDNVEPAKIEGLGL